MKKLIFFIIVLVFSLNVSAQKGVVKDIEERYVNGFFQDKNAHSFFPSEDETGISSLSVFQYLQGKVAGLQITGNPFNPFISYRWGRPALFMNEMRVDSETISSISMNDVALIKVYRPPFIGSFGGGNGAIAVYTKRGDE